MTNEQIRMTNQRPNLKFQFSELEIWDLGHSLDIRIWSSNHSINRAVDCLIETSHPTPSAVDKQNSSPLPLIATANSASILTLP